jgi:LmbE family N-acetylglucosaminyl deacetylase
MTPYSKFIQELVSTFEGARQLRLGEFAVPARPPASDNAPIVLLFSPHPDDECITGALPLRLLRELKMRVINVPVTLGSNEQRKSFRYKELTNACGFLGFELSPGPTGGLEHINPESRRNHSHDWDKAADRVVSILLAHQPRVIVFPHSRDAHPTHIGTSLLVQDALKKMPAQFSCLAVETEYWQPMSKPNLMIGISELDLSDLVTALSFHVGEVERNPYHVTLPAWMMDNVRRGSELVGGRGSEALDITFGGLYRIRKWQSGRMRAVLPSGVVFSCEENLGRLML